MVTSPAREMKAFLSRFWDVLLLPCNLESRRAIAIHSLISTTDLVTTWLISEPCQHAFQQSRKWLSKVEASVLFATGIDAVVFEGKPWLFESVSVETRMRRSSGCVLVSLALVDVRFFRLDWFFTRLDLPGAVVDFGT